MARIVTLLLGLLALVPAASASQPARSVVTDCDTVMNPAPRPARAAHPRDLDLRVRYSADGTRVRWILSLRNRTARTVGVAFPTSQYANVVVRRGGRLMHSWHTRRAFLQAFTHRILGPRKTYVCTLDAGALDLEPGRYELRAYLRSTIRVATRRSLLVNG